MAGLLRRDFLKAGAFGGALAGVTTTLRELVAGSARLSQPVRSLFQPGLAAGPRGGVQPVAAAASRPLLHSPSWVDKPMRWAQLTLVEDDPGKFDARFWLDYFRRTRSDAVCLSAGGCVAYYPTAVPFHHRSRWLGDTDPF